MHAPENLFQAGLIAAAAAALLDGVAVAYFRTRRQASYGGETDWRGNAALRSLPDWDTSATAAVFARYEDVKKAARSSQLDAAARQMSYGDWSVLTVTMALFAFLSTAVGTVWALAHSWESVALIAEIIGLAGTLVSFLRAHAARRRWIEARIWSEWLRQSSIFDGILRPLTTDSFATTAPTSTSLSLAHIRAGGSGAILSLEAAWASRREGFRLSVVGVPLNVEQFVCYLKRRVIRQLQWFENASARMHLREDNRARVLTQLFVGASVIAASKAVSFALDRSGSLVDTLSLVGLILTAAAGTVAAFYAGQNQRTLLHTYRMQERRISEWLTTFLRSNGVPLNQASPTVLSAAEQARMVESVLNFEDSMISELEQWISVTEHDSIELSS